MKKSQHLNLKAYQMDQEDAQRIIDKVVPVLAAPEDQEFFRGVLWVHAENLTAAAFSHFVAGLLNTTTKEA